MKIASSKEIRNIDKRAIEEYGIPGIVLMENAGLQVFLNLIMRYGPLENKRIAIIAGKGNNGGDGFVVARHLFNHDICVHVFIIGKKSDIKGDAKTNLDILRKTGIPFTDNVKPKDLKISLNDADIIIDAIFGTGLSSEVSRPYSDVIEIINSSGKPVVSIDIPSGISSDTGEILGKAVKAALTVTFIRPKRGLVVYPGAENSGILKTADIGIPNRIVEEENIRINLLTMGDVKETIPERRPDTNKASYGHLLVIAGSAGKTGAAAMTSLSALRTGAGLVTLAAPASLIDIHELKPVEVMTISLPETEDRSLSINAEEILYKMLPKMTVTALGPGLSTHPETAKLVRDIIIKAEHPVIVDADGINALTSHLEILKKSKAPLILTPHPGEMARLIGKTSKDVQKDRIGIAQGFSIEHKVILVLKGARTIIADPEGNIFINPTGNPGMATAGSGDVLTGVIGGLIAQGLNPLMAAKTGVYLHGLAGDMAAEEIGETGMIAGDIIERIPKAIKSLKKNE